MRRVDRETNSRVPRLQPMVQRLVDNAPQYQSRAHIDDGRRIRETVLVPAQQPGAASALHSKWQEEGSVDQLTREDCEALARAGYRIVRDAEGYWTWWREQKLTHLWLGITDAGWVSTMAPYPKGAKWKVVGSIHTPMLPFFENFTVTPQIIVREALIVALAVIKQQVPDDLLNDKFFAVAKNLCDEVVNSLEHDEAWFNDIIQQVPCVSEPAEVDRDDDADYTGGVVRS